jgi:predicted RNA-binding Zn-ribbon protein involved in translation (DUF1610 family)
MGAFEGMEEQVDQRCCPKCHEWHAIKSAHEEIRNPTACPKCGWAPQRNFDGAVPD